MSACSGELVLVCSDSSVCVHARVHLLGFRRLTFTRISSTVMWIFLHSACNASPGKHNPQTSSLTDPLGTTVLQGICTHFLVREVVPYSSPSENRRIMAQAPSERCRAEPIDRFACGDGRIWERGPEAQAHWPPFRYPPIDSKLELAVLAVVAAGT